MKHSLFLHSLVRELGHCLVRDLKVIDLMRLMISWFY